MKWTLFLFLMCSSSFLPAQQFTSRLTSSTQENYSPLLKFGDSYFAIENGEKDIELRKYDLEMKMIKSVKLSIENVIDVAEIPLLRIIDGKVCLIYYTKPAKGNIQLFSSVVDPVSLALSDRKQLMNILLKPNSMDYYPGRSGDYNRNRLFYVTAGAEGPSYYKTFFFEPCPDGSKFLLLWNSGLGKDRKVYFSVLDKNMNVIRSGEEQLIELYSFSLSNACIDNSGTVYISYYYLQNHKGHAEVLVNKKTGSSVMQVTIPDGEPYGVFIGINPKENKLYVCGSYIVRFNMAGIYIQSLKLDDQQWGTLIETVFSKELLEIFEKDSWGNTSGKKMGLSCSIIFDLMVLEDGTINLTGEFRTRQESGKSTFDIAGSILNIRFNKNGPVFSRIPKTRVSGGQGISDSYRIFEYKNKLIIFYNDNTSNLKQDISKIPTRIDAYNTSALVAATIAEDGSVTREVVIDKSMEDLISLTEIMHQLSPSSYFIKLQGIKKQGGLKKDFKWALINIK